MSVCVRVEGRAGRGDMEFPGVLKKEHVEIPGQLKKEVEFPGVFIKKLCGISKGLGFWPWNFQKVSHNFTEYPGVKAC